MAFGELLRAKRDALGMTLQEVGDSAGIVKSHMHALEAGKHNNPGMLTCVRISVVLGLNIQAMAAAILSDAMAATTGKDAA